MKLACRCATTVLAGLAATSTGCGGPPAPHGGPGMPMPVLARGSSPGSDVAAGSRVHLAAAVGRTVPARRAEPPRTLVFMLDGVPWSVMDSLQRAGHFRGFARPSVVLAPFPSLTTVAYEGIWREVATPGYEDRYFDRSANRLRGGAWDVLSGREAEQGFHRHVDVQGDPVVSGLAYAFPASMSRLELKQLRTGILETARRSRSIVAYTISTDAIAHAQGRSAQVEMVVRLEAIVNEARRRYPDMRVDLVSDHGNDFIPSHQLPLAAVLARSGLRLAERLAQPGDVVVPRFGLVGSVAFYAAPPDRPRLVQALAAAAGVDFAVWQEDDRLYVQGRTGRARVECDASTSRFRYTVETGDPLGFDPLRHRLAAAGELDADGFAPDTAWLRESFATPYADALRRLVIAYRGEVLNPATVLVSLAPGGHFGDPVGDRLTRMEGTHGSLRTNGSTAFLMSTDGPRPPVLRADEVLSWLPLAVQPRQAGPSAPTHMAATVSSAQTRMAALAPSAQTRMTGAVPSARTRMAARP